ncbi:MAG TPA: AMP-binding protein [Myxococcaceae bacterium]|nr:AMP-binding protein [Myxococcaceae bacterium]
MAPRTLPLERSTARTLPAALAESARRVPDRTFLRFLDPAQGEGPPRDVRFSDFRLLVCRAAAFLTTAGVGPGVRVLLLAENSPEWQALALAAQLLRAEPAALFASLSGPAVVDIARRVRPKLAFVSSAEQWAKLAPVGGELALGGLTTLLTSESTGLTGLPPGVRSAQVASALGEGAPALSLPDFEARAASVGEDDPFLLLFTSGTTGRQKGVRLAQRALIHALDAGGIATRRTERDVGVHLLPFGHIAGHDQFALALLQGHTLILIARRDELPRALGMGPSYLFSVPLVYERIRSRALGQVERLPPLLRRLIHASLDAATRVRVEHSGGLADRALALLADALLGRRVRAALGGQVEGLFAGGAPTSEALFRFFEALGIPLVDLYGMSETAGLISANLFDGPRRPGVAGLFTPDHEVLVAPDGELLLRGPLLLTGYLEPEDAAGAYTEDGFFRTGDLVSLDADGWLRIVGRKKHLMVLATGKKVPPEPLEIALGSAPPFEGAMMLGDDRPFVAAVVFVPRDELERISAAGADPAQALLPGALEALAGFSDYEKPKRLLVVPGSPADYPELITPTLKLRRAAVLDMLRTQIQALYA